LNFVWISKEDFSNQDESTACFKKNNWNFEWVLIELLSSLAVLRLGITRIFFKSSLNFDWVSKIFF
jgi:hypothetical protein